MNYKSTRIRFENYFSNLFPSLIFKNKIVSTIIYNIMREVGLYKVKIDKRTNKDI